MSDGPFLLHDLKEKIYSGYQEENKREKYFTRLGASGIGRECLRAVFYSWRGFTEKEFPGRILRLFKTGHLQEDRIVADLQRAGLKIWAVDENGKQYKFLDSTGHLVDKPDGVVKGVFEGSEEKFLLEIKTMSDKAFKKLEGGGIYKQDHKFQVQTGIWLLGLNYGLYVVLNKNDEDYHIEVIERDEKIIARLQARLKKLILVNTAPPRVSDECTSFICQWCDYRSVCTGETPPVKSCRSCSYVLPVQNGEWLCEKHGISLNMKQQVSGCEDYLEFGK